MSNKKMVLVIIIIRDISRLRIYSYYIDHIRNKNNLINFVYDDDENSS